MTGPALPTPDPERLEALDRDALLAALHERVAAAWRLCREVHPGLPRPAVWCGLTPRTTHRFDTARASPAPYRYACDCREHAFGARRHARVRQGQRYRCRHCAQTLVYLGMTVFESDV